MIGSTGAGWIFGTFYQRSADRYRLTAIFLQDPDQDCWFVGPYLDPNSLTINTLTVLLHLIKKSQQAWTITEPPF